MAFGPIAECTFEIVGAAEAYDYGHCSAGGGFCQMKIRAWLSMLICFGLPLGLCAQQPGYIGGVLTGIGEQIREENKRNEQKRIDAHFATVKFLRQLCEDGKLPFDLSLRCAEPVMTLLQIPAEKSNDRDFKRATERVLAVLAENRKRSITPPPAQSAPPPWLRPGIMRTRLQQDRTKP